jgi:hypothetical protein
MRAKRGGNWARFLLLAIALCIACAGQALGQYRRADAGALDRSAGPVRLVVMPLDVQLSLLTAGGVQEPSAEWTETATQLLAAAISDYGKARGIVAVPFDEARLAGDEVDTALQLVKLHGLVGRSITVYQLSDGAQLPTKADSFDWSLGPQVEVIGRTQQADYALFIFLRDSYASGGRVAATVLGAMVGVALPAPAQIGFASVVDLKTGNVARFNLVRRLTGNVRTPEGARETVQELLKGLRE